MSVYSSAVDAYRETTKWLTAFLPITALASAGVLVGPRLAASAQAASSPAAWAAEHWTILLSLLALGAAVAAILWSGATVLSCEPTDLSNLGEGQGSRSLTAAIGAGVAAPAFFTREDYDAAMSELADAWDNKSATGDDPRVVRLGTAVESLREWSLYHNIQRPFRRFRVVFVVSSLVMLVATAYVPFALGPSTAIEEPTKVAVQVSAEGVADLKAQTDCTDAAASEFLAVGGTWEQPLLTVDGPGCRFGSTWRPGDQHAALRLHEDAGSAPAVLDVVSPSAG